MASTADGQDSFYAGKAKPRGFSYDAADTPYEPVDAIAETTKAGGMLSFAGLAASAIQNSLARQNVGFMGVFTRTGGTVLVFGGIGSGYAFGSSVAANLREKNDSYNHAIGGALGGCVPGLAKRSFTSSVSGAAILATVMAVYSYTGGYFGYKSRDPEQDTVSHKEYLKKNRRRPVEETIMELGEGRGIYGPGYEERRARRIKEKYGIDVPVGPQSAS